MINRLITITVVRIRHNEYQLLDQPVATFQRSSIPTNPVKILNFLAKQIEETPKNNLYSEYSLFAILIHMNKNEALGHRKLTRV